MEISCILPAFENLDLFSRCLVSVLAQKGVRLDVVVSDDSRTDEVRLFTAALAAAYPFVRYLDGPRSGNPVDNWNHGLAAAAAPICVLAHHDEFYLDPDFLRRAKDRLDLGDAQAVIGRTCVIGAGPRSNFRAAGVLARALGRPAWLLASVNWIGPTAAFVFRRGPSFDPSLVQLVDVDFYRRVLGAGPVVLIDGAAVASLGHHGRSISARIDPHRTAIAELGAWGARASGGAMRALYAGHEWAWRLRAAAAAARRRS